MLDRILVPLDGSPLAERVVPHAVTLSQIFGSSVVLLSVREREPQAGRDVDSREWRMARAEVRGYLERVAGAFREAGIPVEVRLLEGCASGRILDMAREEDIDLIVLSSHGCGGVTDFPLSGTAAKVVAAADRSVLVIRPGEGPTAEPGKDLYRRILAPVDCTAPSDFGAMLAASMARPMEAELILATVVPHSRPLGDPAKWSEQVQLTRRLTALNRETAEKHLATLCVRLDGSLPDIRTRILDAEHVGPALDHLAEEEDVSLLVLTAHGRPLDDGWPYGAVAAGLLQYGTRPVLVFKEREGASRDRRERATRWRVRAEVRRIGRGQ